jgi:autotransporter-associated beta strand protein
VANNTITVGSGSQFTVTSAIGGSGSLSKNGSGPLYLTAANTYSGNTVISGGTMALYGGGDGSISSSVNIDVTSGATLDVSGRSDSTFTLAGGQVLMGGSIGTNGPGFINGILVASAGSFVTPGTSATNNGVLNVSSNATLNGTTTMKLNAGAGVNDQLIANAVAYNGTLIVTNFSGIITNGQSFQLFVATNGYSGTFGSITLPSASGLTWTNTLSLNGTITAGVVSTTPAQPHITSINLSGTTLVISGTNGTPGQQYEVLTSTNLTLALANWISISTNTFTSGNFSVTNTVNPNTPQSFFLLRLP